MSDEPKQPSHPVRLAVSMAIGVFVGSIFVQMALPWTTVLCILGGALAGLAVELFRRSLEAAHQIDALHSLKAVPIDFWFGRPRVLLCSPAFCCAKPESVPSPALGTIAACFAS
jgi:hypothetical protein